MASLLVTLTLILIINLVILYYLRKRKFRSLDKVPGPKSYPVFGSLFAFGFSLVDIFENLVLWSEQFENNPFYKMWIGPWHLYLFSSDPQFIEFILSSPKHIKKSTDYDLFKLWLKNGLITSTGRYWQKHRKLITPAFHYKMLEGYVNVFNTRSNILIEKLANYVDKGDFDVQPYIFNCTLDIICESAMGSEAQSTTFHKFGECAHLGMKITISRIFSGWKRSDILFQFSSDFKKLQNALEYGLKFTNHLINERKNKMLNNNNNNEAETVKDDVGMKKKQVFLDTLLRGTIDGKPLTDEEILEEVNTFVHAGSDTSAGLLTFALYELAKNPEIQNKLFLEVKDIYGDDKSYEPQIGDLNAMKYTELVLKETLRLYSTIPYIGRQLEEDVNYNGTIIPAGTLIFLFIYGVQRRKDLFPQARKFDPDRFLSKSDKFVPFSYVPFSAGPRNCIGQKFAMYEAICLLSKIVMNFEILPADSKCDLQLAGAIILLAPNGVHIQLKRRQIERNSF